MNQTTQVLSLNDLTKNIIEAIEDKKGYEIVSIDLRKLNNPFTDMFIICHGTSDKQVEAIADNIERQISQKFREKPVHREGYENKEWILLDYFDVVVHIFQEEKRYFFNLESLWGDGEIKKYN